MDVILTALEFLDLLHFSWPILKANSSFYDSSVCFLIAIGGALICVLNPTGSIQLTCLFSDSLQQSRLHPKVCTAPEKGKKNAFLRCSCWHTVSMKGREKRKVLLCPLATRNMVFQRAFANKWIVCKTKHGRGGITFVFLFYSALPHVSACYVRHFFQSRSDFWRTRAFFFYWAHMQPTYLMPMCIRFSVAGV